jgi:hypothetical protein
MTGEEARIGVIGAAGLNADQEVDGLAPIKVLRRLSGGWRRGGEQERDENGRSGQALRHRSSSRAYLVPFDRAGPGLGGVANISNIGWRAFSRPPPSAVEHEERGGFLLLATA